MIFETEKVKIATKFSGIGGSTLSLAELCNAFNKRGILCCMYGPHEWHKEKCHSKNIRDYKICEGDRIIQHLFELNERPVCKRMVLSCHEKSYFNVSKRATGYDVIRYVSESQKNWHNFRGVEGVVIPNPVSGLKATKGTPGVVGIIGSLSKRKRSHLAIQNALDSGAEKILVFGLRKGSDSEYLEEFVDPLLELPNVEYKGFVEDRQLIYDSISAVYHTPKEECACRLQRECEITQIPFYGEGDCQPYNTWDDDTIIDKWIEILDL